MSVGYPVSYLMIVIICMSIVTFLARATSFLFIEKIKDNVLIQYVGKYLPACIMLVLAIFCTWDTIEIHERPYGLNEVLAVVTVALIHMSTRNSLFSIVAGTGLYMFLINSEVLSQLF
jgi:branched-subunit amino acid transport protein AzlD